MKAFVLKSDSFELENIPEPNCQESFSKVKVLCTSLNHRDLYISEGKYAKIQLPAVLGSDVCGLEAGSRIIVDPSMQWGDDPKAQGPLYNPIGMPSQGALAEHVCVPDANIYPAPLHLNDEQSSAIPMAGVTAWRALFTRGGLQPGDTVLITGIGGGVATFILQYAVAAGAHVIVSSRSQQKLNSALKLGAHEAVLLEQLVPNSSAHGAGDTSGTDSSYSFSDADRKKLKEFNIGLITDSVGGDSVNDLTDVLRPGGRLVFYGTSKGAAPSVNLHRVYWKQLNLLGSTMGTAQDFTDMLNFINEHKIVPVIDSIFDLEHTADAFQRMKSGQQFGKIVIRIS